MFKRVSLKYKLLLLLVLAPVLTLISYLLMAKSIFEEDKVAYIYNTNLTNTQTISKQLVSELEIIEKTRDVILTGYKSEKEVFDDIAMDTFYSDKKLLLIQVLANTGVSNFNLVGDLKKDKLPAEITDFVESNVTSAFSEVLTQNQIVKVVNAEQGMFALFNIHKTRENKGFLIATVFKSDLILNSFYGDGLFQNYLINNEGKVIMGKGSVWDNKTNNFNALDFYQRILSNKFDTGTLEAMKEKKATLLVAYSRLPLLGYTIVSIIEKEFALRAVYTLIVKSLIFLIFVVSLSIILSVIASNKLTITLRKLVKGADEIGQGKFNIKVETNSKDEIGRLGDSFNIMALKVSSLLKELQAYNEQLEQKVEERTAELNKALKLQEAMVDSLGQGFFIFNENGEVLPVYSKASEEIFETNPSGKFIGELLKLPDEEQDSFKDFCRSMIAEDLPFQDMVIMAPEKVKREDKSIFLEYNPIRDEEEKVSGVVVVATDKTEEVKALQEAEKERKFVEMIVKMMSNKGQFIKFLQETKKYITNTREFIKSGKHPENGELKEDVLFRGMHTLKGNSGLFSMAEAQKYAHEVEGFITQIKNTPEPQKPPLYEQLLEMFDKMEKIFIDFVEGNKKLIGVKSWNDFSTGLEVPVENLQHFFNKMKKHNIHDELLDDFIDSIYSEPVTRFLSQYIDLAEEVALKLGKKINPLTIEGGEVRLNGKIYDELFSSLVHAVRNAIDHGIEFPHIRKERGKPEFGTIGFFVEKIQSDKGTLLQVRMKDDGGGVNPEIIRKKMTENGHEEKIKNMNDQEVIQMIFSAGFSTNTAVTDISGRGVGMDAIMNVCKQLGGTIWVESKVGVGSEFIIQVPFKRQ